MKTINEIIESIPRDMAVEGEEFWDKYSVKLMMKIYALEIVQEIHKDIDYSGDYAYVGHEGWVEHEDFEKLEKRINDE